jgi:hypothetical protein
LKAIVLYDEAARKENAMVKAGEILILPELVFVITGKGPQKEEYVTKIKVLKLKYCRILTAWLTMEDYPKLLGILKFSILFSAYLLVYCLFVCLFFRIRRSGSLPAHILIRT